MITDFKTGDRVKFKPIKELEKLSNWISTETIHNRTEENLMRLLFQDPKLENHNYVLTRPHNVWDKEFIVSLVREYDNCLEIGEPHTGPLGYAHQSEWFMKVDDLSIAERQIKKEIYANS
jgi:hypothetical protein